MSIVGGETASLPEIIRGFDLAGTAIGVVDKDKVVTGERIKKGDVLVGVPSSGLHSNGYTLARAIVAQSGYSYHDRLPGGKGSLGEELLVPTRIYHEVLELVRGCDIHGLAHITGSGLLKLRRISVSGGLGGGGGRGGLPDHGTGISHHRLGGGGGIEGRPPGLLAPAPSRACPSISSYLYLIFLYFYLSVTSSRRTSPRAAL